jgi:hypothetical protein
MLTAMQALVHSLIMHFSCSGTNMAASDMGDILGVVPFAIFVFVICHGPKPSYTVRLGYLDFGQIESDYFCTST